MSSPETIIRTKEPIRPLKRVEYDELGRLGYFDDEKVELLFGMVVEMSPIDRAHIVSGYRIRRALERGLGERAMVLEGSPFAASEISEPQPDVLVTAPGAHEWKAHADRAFLVVEVSRSSLAKDTGPKAVLYGLAEVDEYWIVDHVNAVVEVYRDRHEGSWRTKSTYLRGATIALAAFPDVTIEVAEILPPAEI
ncbi:MAG: Uma2 family endonuclease [Kofleriaceae bacterium]